jgi:hypothetical protein
MTELSGPLQNVRELIGSVQEAVLGMKMEMTEPRHAESPGTITVEGAEESAPKTLVGPFRNCPQVYLLMRQGSRV